MKIAYLIKAYKDPKHLNKLINAINDSNADIFLHINKKSNLQQFNLPKLKNLFVLKNNIETYWGSYTTNNSVILMIEKALKTGNYDYFIVLSGADYPIRSNKHILNYFSKNKGKEFINICKMPEKDKSFDRLNYFYISTFDRNNDVTNKIKMYINILIKKLNIKRKYPKEYNHLILYGGSDWWALTEPCIKYIINFIKQNPIYVQFYKHTYIPEEMFFHTIIGNSKFKKNIVNTIMYTDWSPKTGPLPATINESHLKILSKNTQPTDYGNGKMHALFARKFNDRSGKILKIIDRKLRIK